MTTITKDGHTMESAAGTLRQAHEERWPDRPADGLAEWLAGYECAGPAESIEALVEEYLGATQEIIDLHHGNEA